MPLSFFFRFSIYLPNPARSVVTAATPHAPVSSGVYPQLFSVFFIDGQKGWAAGNPEINMGLLISTTDGGATWVHYAGLPANAFHSVCFADDQKGWVVGLSGNIFHTVDGGATWISQQSGTGSSLYDVYFTDAEKGSAVGATGRILRTWNGGIPVELTSFTASVDNNNVGLIWTTATELNNRGFDIERAQLSREGISPDGIKSNVENQNEWVKIGYVPGYGTTTEPRSYSFTDTDLKSGNYSYRLKQMDYEGKFKYSEVVDIEIVPVTPSEYSLGQNYPNPFNPSTKIKYSIPVFSSVTIKVYDILGKEIETLVDEKKSAGTYELKWDAGRFSAGVYVYKLTADNFTIVKKMLMLK